MESEEMPSKFLSNGVLRDLLSKANESETTYLSGILGIDNRHVNNSILQKEICECGGHGVTNFFRGQGTGYLDIVDDVANKLEISGLTPYSDAVGSLSVSEFDERDALKASVSHCTNLGIYYAEKAEEKIILKLLDEAYKKMSPEEKRSFDNQINDVAKKFGSDPTKKLAGTAGLMVLGNLGGFATYTFLTTTMSAISMGTLGFGAYTTATSALSVFLGPVGWAGLGVAAVYSYGKADFKKLIPIVTTVGAIRQRIKYENS
jgi:uncharacterized protein YaaW (UPF0174 family)